MSFALLDISRCCLDSMASSSLQSENNAGPCPTEFKCMSNGACIDNATKLCDFTNECSDQTDEDPTMCGKVFLEKKYFYFFIFVETSMNIEP